MPKDKKPIERYQRINEIFQRLRGVNTAIKLTDLAERLDISERQLGTDMKVMREKGAPFEYVAALRGWRYQPGRDFAFVDDQMLNDEDVLNIQMAIEMFNKINPGQQPAGKLPQIFQKIYKASRKWTQHRPMEKFIYFDPLPQYEGSKHLHFFLQCIEHTRRVELQYQGYHAATPKTLVFDPWFLRHYDRRWYVGGFSHDPAEGFVRVFPLERIIAAPKAIGFFHDRPPNYDAATYWQHIYGITVSPDGKVAAVVLQFSYQRGRYFLDTPFFIPFEVLEQGADKIIVRLQLIPNIDLIRKLASLGKDVQVLAPDSLRTKMTAFHQAALAARE